MDVVLKVILIVLAVLVAIVALLYFVGRKAQKKQSESKAAMDAAQQTMTLFIIDLKKMRLKDAGLPKAVLESTPKYARLYKMPIVKVKVGSRVMSLIADPKVYNQLLPKQEVKATVSGLYITSAKRIRGPIPEPKAKKKSGKEKRAEKKANK
ncbi:MAG: hypothetical protein IJW18_08855 [Lachnospiraceae bacterium]|nr:hypothetical protein [Lachnospiraceae bacterium]